MTAGIKPKSEDRAEKAKAVSDRNVVRWYLMSFPFGKKGLTVGLERELERRKRAGETLFEYFAPTYVATKDVDGKLVTTQESLLFNYFFIRASEDDLFVLKRNQPQYSVLRRTSRADGSYGYPFVSDRTIETLQWIARSYGGYVPLCLLDQTLLFKGDRIRITKGQFKGIEARVVTKPKSEFCQIMVLVDNWMCVPLMNVSPAQYEVIDLINKEEKEKKSHGLDNPRLAEKLHEALCRFRRGGAMEDDTKLAQDVFRKFSDTEVDTVALRCTLYSLLLPACVMLGYAEKADGIVTLVGMMLPKITAELSLASLLVTVYGCTDNIFYYEKAHQLVAAWRNEYPLKKGKQIVAQRLADYDECLGH